MVELMRQAQQMAKLGFVSPAGIEQLFTSGQDGNRIMALGLMRGEPKFADASIAAKVIRQPRSGFEQWEALCVSQDLIRGNVSSEEFKFIREAIEIAEANGSLVTGLDRSRSTIAGQILQAISADQ